MKKKNNYCSCISTILNTFFNNKNWEKYLFILEIKKNRIIILTINTMTTKTISVILIFLSKRANTLFVDFLLGLWNSISHRNIIILLKNNVILPSSPVFKCLINPL